MFPKGTINGYFDPHDQGMGSKLTGRADQARHGATGRRGRRSTGVAAGLVNPGTKSPLVLSVGSAFANVKGIVSYKPGARPPTADALLARDQPQERLQQPDRPVPAAARRPPADYMAMQGNSILDLVQGRPRHADGP